MNVSIADDSLDIMERKIGTIVHRFPWVQMILFSELAAFGPSTAKAQAFPGAAEQRFCELASRYGVWLLPGSMFEHRNGRVYNTASVIDPTGHVVGRYRKMFPFRPYEIGVESGDEFLVFDVPEVGRFGVSICYDMWFPETTRTLVAMGAEVILHPSMTDTIDRDVEISIARASAVINQCYFFDINGVGECGNGRSIIVGPSGYVIHEAGSGEEIIPVEINLSRVRRERELGIRGLGQPLKSFRDRPVDFSVYSSTNFGSGYLNTLGPLEVPTRKTVAANAPAGTSLLTDVSSHAVNKA
ncbi:MAG: carbon-nitrogen hydrolase family protein [Proteobacteria bacterium]|nr:MAG: carbon-nitrogen hydrolase family protein [Pseudomonadota bacterium]